MHKALEKALIYSKNHKVKLEQVIEYFNQDLINQQIPNHEFERYLKRGIEKLTRLFNVYNYEINKFSLAEQNLKDIRLGKSKISGKLDRIDLLDNEIRVIDYKTGTSLSSFNSRDQSLQTKIWRNKTQLQFYELLIRPIV